MSARGARRLGILLAALAWTALSAKDEPGAAPSIVDLPPLLAWTDGPAGSSWSRCMFLLTGRAHGEPALQVSSLCVGDAGPVVHGVAPAPNESRDLSSEPGADGGVRILVGRAGGIDQLELAARDRPVPSVTLVEDDLLRPDSVTDRPDLDGDGRRDLVQGTYDGVSLWRREEDGRMKRLPGARVPPLARFDGETVSVEGRLLVAPEPPAAERFTWPETLGGSRLRTYRVTLFPSGVEPCAAWIDTDSPVYVARAVFVSGEPPRLVALVAPRDKLAVFGNFTLLVAPLTCDETARGSRPTLRVATRFDSNFGWTQLGVRDVTGDGRADIVVVGRQGLVNEKLEVSVYPGTADGSFSATAASTTRSDLDPLGAIWDKDQDGDGRLDLVVLERSRLVLARGVAVRGPGEVPFDLRKPSFVPLPDSVTARALVGLVDLDGNGRLVALVRGEERADEGRKKPAPGPLRPDLLAEKNTRLVIVRFPGPR